MFKFICCLFFICLTIILNVQGQPPEKPTIHGFPFEDGEEIAIEKAPYQASLLYYGWIFICSGIIVSERAILTAAHCIMGHPNQWVAHVGSVDKVEGGEKYPVEKMVVHEGHYEDNGDESDICLFIVANYMAIDGITIAIIPLVPPHYELPEDITTGYATAWGSMGDPNITDSLKALEVPFIDNDKCKESFKDLSHIKITDNIICAGEAKDKCQGDSGAPLTVECFLVGMSTRYAGCAGEGSPGIWIRMSSVSEWVYKWIDEMEKDDNMNGDKTL